MCSRLWLLGVGCCCVLLSVVAVRRYCLLVSLFVAVGCRCCLFNVVVRCLVLFVVVVISRCLLFVVSGLLLFVVCCSLRDVRWWLLVVRCVLFAG